MGRNFKQASSLGQIFILLVVARRILAPTLQGAGWSQMVAPGDFVFAGLAALALL